MPRWILGVLLLGACGDAARSSQGAVSVEQVGGVPVYAMQPPDSVLAWHAEIAACLGITPKVGPWQIRWLAGDLPYALAGMAVADYDGQGGQAILLDFDLALWPRHFERRLIVRHEMVHLMVGTDATHQPIRLIGGTPSADGMDHERPREYFNAECGTGRRPREG